MCKTESCVYNEIMILSKKKRYLQIALNSTLSDAFAIIDQLPLSDRIILEAGTPLIKEFGASAIREIYTHWREKLWGLPSYSPIPSVFESDISQIGKAFIQGLYAKSRNNVPLPVDSPLPTPYVAADLKTMDRAETEVSIAKNAGASAAICLGLAPLETINSFIDSCTLYGMDSMLDMMNIEYPITILRKLKKQPDVVMLHRGVDEEKFNRDKPIPYLQINKILSSYNVMISIAGGDTIREVQRAVFNSASIVVAWKEFYHSTADTGMLAEDFLKEIK